MLVENSENALFEIRRELEEERHFARAASVLADCKDATRVREVFEEHAPSVVFHAAAYKHVPLMEENPVEAVRNNAVATRIVAAAAGEAGVERFVLVSTDKAVSPATVMGASKALAEWAVEAAQNRWKGTRYASVRFGNVLGSSGSVVPIFRRQIAKGGPVTVTDSRMTRYFMTIPEAVQLIIRSGELATGGEVFVLEMGDPVKIVDLAANMIRLAGYEPDVDIAIEIVGRRPGEKIHEELFNPGERPQPTPAEKIVCAVQPPLDPEWVESAFARIEELVYGGDAAALAGAVAELSAERALAIASERLSRRTPPAFYSSTLAGDRPGDRRLRRAGLGGGAGGALGPLLLAGPRREAAARVGRARARALGAGRAGRAGPRGGAAAAAGAPGRTPGGRPAAGAGASRRRRRSRRAPSAGHAGRQAAPAAAAAAGAGAGDGAAEQAAGGAGARRAERERGSGRGQRRQRAAAARRRSGPASGASAAARRQSGRPASGERAQPPPRQRLPGSKPSGGRPSGSQPAVRCRRRRSSPPSLGWRPTASVRRSARRRSSPGDARRSPRRRTRRARRARRPPPRRRRRPAPRPARQPRPAAPHLRPPRRAPPQSASAVPRPAPPRRQAATPAAQRGGASQRARPAARASPAGPGSPRATPRRRRRSSRPGPSSGGRLERPLPGDRARRPARPRRGAAYGVTQLTGDDDGGGSSSGRRRRRRQERLRAEPKQQQGGAVKPSSVTVAVLNGTTVPGLAATLSDEVGAAGFKVGTITNFSDQQLAESVVQYAPGHEAEARAVSRRLGIAQREPVNPSSQALAGDATVIVIAGADKAP